jgi:DNA/RNA-binding domain of Phe-tRNA-synthetase-like protein
MAAAALRNGVTVHIAPEVLHQFPQATVSFLVAEMRLEKAAGDAKAFLANYRQRVVQQLRDRGITEANHTALDVCRAWDAVYKRMNAGDEKRCSIEQLLKRWARAADKGGKNPDVGSFNNFVDFYNCVSVDTLSPMGALHLDKIRGIVSLRFGKAGEIFTPLSGRKDAPPVIENVTPEQIVYADAESVLTWLFNYRDGAHCCVPKDSQEPTRIILFSERAEDVGGDPERAIQTAAENLPQMGGRVLARQTLTKERPEVMVEF